MVAAVTIERPSGSGDAALKRLLWRERPTAGLPAGKPSATSVVGRSGALARCALKNLGDRATNISDPFSRPVHQFYAARARLWRRCFSVSRSRWLAGPAARSQRRALKEEVVRQPP